MAVKIVLDTNPRGLFYVAGDKITGRAIITSSSKKILERAAVFCLLKENANIKHGGWHYFPNKTHVSLAFRPVQSPQEIPAGETIFNFSFQLPSSSQVAKLAPVRASTGHGVFEIENSIEFTVRYKSIFGSTDECKIPIPIGPIWNPEMVLEKDRGDFSEHMGPLSSCCDCFSEKTYGTIRVIGIPKVSHSAGRVTQPMKIHVKCAEDNEPQSITLELVGETEIRHVNFNLKKTTYYFKSMPWDSRTVKEEGYFVMAHDAKFEVGEYELLTARAYCWRREYRWEVNVEFKKGGSLAATFPVIFGFLDSNEKLSTTQKALASVAFYGGSDNYTVEDKEDEEVTQKENEEATQEEKVAEDQPADENMQNKERQRG